MPSAGFTIILISLGSLVHVPDFIPFLSSWDRDQENSAFVGRELFRQAYSTPPDLYRPSSEQAKRAGPNMTDEGHTMSHHTLVVCRPANRRARYGSWEPVSNCVTGRRM